MYDLNSIITGLKTFLDSEFLSKIQGVNKWLIGAGLNMALDNSVNVFNLLKSNQFIKSMELISQDDEIDVDKIYKYLSAQAKKSAVTFSVPLIGAVTLKADDVDKLYSYITRSKK